MYVRAAWVCEERCVGEWFDVGGSVKNKRAWMWVKHLFFFFLSLNFITGIVRFSVKSDIGVTVQSHLKMCELCATTRVMCLSASHSYCTCVGCVSPVPVLRLRFVLCGVRVWYCAGAPLFLVTSKTGGRHRDWSLPQGRSTRRTHCLCRSVHVRVTVVDRDLRGVLGHRDRSVLPPAFSWVLVPSSPRYRARHASVPGRSGCRASPNSVKSLNERSRLRKLRHG